MIMKMLMLNYSERILMYMKIVNKKTNAQELMHLSEGGKTKYI